MDYLSELDFFFGLSSFFPKLKITNAICIALLSETTLTTLEKPFSKPLSAHEPRAVRGFLLTKSQRTTQFYYFISVIFFTTPVIASSTIYKSYVIISLWLLPKCFSGGILAGGKYLFPKLALPSPALQIFFQCLHLFVLFSNLTVKSPPKPLLAPHH